MTKTSPDEPGKVGERHFLLIDVVDHWTKRDGSRISEKTLRHHAQGNEIPNAIKGDRDQWLIPLEYLEEIYLRKPEPLVNRVEAAIEPDTMALIAQNLLNISTSAIHAHQQAQSTTQQAHEREVETLHHQLDISRTETTKAVTHTETLAAELDRLRETLHLTQLDLTRYQTSQEIRQALEPQIDDLASKISRLIDTLNTKTHWWHRLSRRDRSIQT